MADETRTWRDVPCPQCGAPARQKCFTKAGTPAFEPHVARIRAAGEAGLPTPLLGYPHESETPHVVSAVDSMRAICGAELVTPHPVLQPGMDGVDPKCRNLLPKVPYAVALPLTGACPGCLSDEDLDEQGLIMPHRVLYGGTRLAEDCGGAGQKPEADQ
jgi:hypothetical protein